MALRERKKPGLHHPKLDEFDVQLGRTRFRCNRLVKTFKERNKFFWGGILKHHLFEAWPPDDARKVAGKFWQRPCGMGNLVWVGGSPCSECSWMKPSCHEMSKQILLVAQLPRVQLEFFCMVNCLGVTTQLLQGVIGGQ